MQPPYSNRSRRFRAGVAVGLAVFVAGCASRPEHIKPTYVSEDRYLGWTCEQLTVESHRLADALAVASEKQKKTASGDAAGVFLIGLPVSSMSGGDIEPEVARLKGETEAVQRASDKQGCGAAPSTPAVTPAPAEPSAGAGAPPQ